MMRDRISKCLVLLLCCAMILDLISPAGTLTVQAQDNSMNGSMTVSDAAESGDIGEVPAENSDNKEVPAEREAAGNPDYGEPEKIEDNGNTEAAGTDDTNAEVTKTEDGNTEGIHTIESSASLSQNVYELEYKPALQSLLAMFPSSFMVTSADGTIHNIKADWVCLENYDDTLGTYHFQPAGEGMDIAGKSALPVITVNIEKEDAGPTSGDITLERECEVSYVKPQSANAGYSMITYASSAEWLSASYNGYEAGNLPPIRNQGAYGTCWAHAALGAMETDMIRKGANRQEINLSELQMAYFTSHQVSDPKGCRSNDTTEYKGTKGYLNNGGAQEQVYRSIAFQVGPVSESRAPYSEAEVYRPDDEEGMNYNVAGLKTAYNYNIGDKDSIKRAIVEHGSVVTAFQSSTGDYSDGTKVRYSAGYNSYYGNYAGTDHAIMLVGWDDNFPKENFHEELKPAEDGAWLVRNSWGLEGYGQRGYFWLSYQDAGLKTKGLATAFETDSTMYDHVYGYDGATIGDTTYAYKKTIELSESFPVDAGEKVQAVGIEVCNAGLSIQATAALGTKSVSRTIIAPTEGFYRIDFSNSLLVTSASKVKVTIQLTSEDDQESVKVVVERGSKFGDIYYTAHNDSDLTINGSQINRDARLKLYTDNLDASDYKKIELLTPSVKDYYGTEHQLMLSEESEVEVSDLIWSSMDKEIATVSADGVITVGAKKGTTMVVGEYPSTGQTVLCEVTVKPYSIQYVLTEDVEQLKSYDEFYPGDAENCKLPPVKSNHVYVYHSFYRPWYDLTGWYKDENLLQEITEEDLFQTQENLVLYPKWTPRKFNIYQYKIDNQLNYGKSGYLVAGSISRNDLPYILKNMETAIRQADKMAVSYNEISENEPVIFDYWSYDAAGKNPVLSVSEGDFPYKVQANICYQKDLWIYPQYKICEHRGGKATCQERAKCDICGNYYGELAEHSGGKATCQERAKCDICGNYYGELAEHSGGKATCQERAKCDICGNYYGELKAHNYDSEWTADTTGHYHECLVCGERLEAVPVPHSSDGEATETKAELCTECGYEISPVLSHHFVIDAAERATCTTNGKTQGSHCDQCGLVLIQQEEIPATGHSWDAGRISRHPTTDKPGERAYVCTICKEVRKEEIPCLDGLISLIEVKKDSNKGKYVWDVSLPEMISYSGNVITLDSQFTLVKKDGSTVRLAEGNDYTIRYASNKVAGKAFVTYKGIGDYKSLGTITKSYRIQPLDIGEESSTVFAGDLYFANKQRGKVAAKPIVYHNGKKMKLGRDYRLVKINPDGSSEAYNGRDKIYEDCRIKIVGLHNYTGEKEVRIRFQAEKDTTILLSKTSIRGIRPQTYEGKTVVIPKAAYTVRYGKNILTEGKDYEVSYIHNDKPGTATMIITALPGSDYSGVKYVHFKIKPVKLTNAKAQLRLGDAMVGTSKGSEAGYTGSAIEPQVTLQIIRDGKMISLQENIDYTVRYRKNRRKGIAQVIVKGIGGYTGSKNLKFKIIMNN